VITGFALVCLNVLDLDQAKRFYVDVLGFEVGIDSEMDGFRWLTVHPRGRPDMPMMLVVPEPPAVEEPIAGQLRSLVARGYLGLGALRTDDCRATCEELKARGVDPVEPLLRLLDELDAAFRDPFGNHWRLTQPKSLDAIRESAG
jgi:catechol 2,3-dioxygenase-like lactoylglutathione lyase family enzyme